MSAKTIHYCWFGGNKKSRLIKKCIKSWHKYLPDFEIKEWNESNFDINCCRYVREAYEAKKWAFVSDYARFEILNKYGGLYFDTDVEVLKPFDSVFFTQNFVALEDDHNIATGLVMYCEPDDDFCKWMLCSYQNDEFVLKDGSLNLYTVCQRTTKYFVERCFEYKDEKQKVADYVIYPTEYFCPYRFNQDAHIVINTYSIHHYNASWIPKRIKLKRLIIKILGVKLTKVACEIKRIVKGHKWKENN